LTLGCSLSNKKEKTKFGKITLWNFGHPLSHSAEWRNMFANSSIILFYEEKKLKKFHINQNDLVTIFIFNFPQEIFLHFLL
jgi:hypothetical protein